MFEKLLMQVPYATIPIKKSNGWWFRLASRTAVGFILQDIVYLGIKLFDLEQLEETTLHRLLLLIFCDTACMNSALLVESKQLFFFTSIELENFNSKAVDTRLRIAEALARYCQQTSTGVQAKPVQPQMNWAGPNMVYM